MNTLPETTTDFWTALASPADPAAPLDYASLSFDADTWFLAPDARLMMIKEGDYDYPLSEIGDYVENVTIQLSNLLSRKVSPAKFLNCPLAINETDNYAQMAALSMALWLEQIDWDEGTVERVRETLSAPHLKAHLELFQYGLRDLGIEAEKLISKNVDRRGLKQALHAHERAEGWAAQFRDVNAETDLSRACADMALGGIEAHWSHKQDLYRVAAQAYARDLNPTK